MTRDEYANYRVELVWAWGGKVWPPRDKTARDSGLLVHSTGPDGAVSKSWMQAYQCNMLEGATGDVSVTGPDKAYTFRAEAEERPWGKKTAATGRPGPRSATSPPATGSCWFNRDPDWENVLGFRGKNDVEKPVGEWNTLVVTMKARHDDDPAQRRDGEPGEGPGGHQGKDPDPVRGVGGAVSRRSH